MILGASPVSAVIAVDPSLRVGKLTGHWLSIYGLVKLSPLQFHIYGAAVTDRTLVGRAHIVFVTFAMYIMTASHRDDSFGRSEHPIIANRTVAFGGTLYASMATNPSNTDANIAFLVFQ